MQKRIFLFLVWIAAAGTRRAELVNLTFDELAPQSADGVSLAGATFGFTVNGTALDEAIYGTTDGPREQEASLMRGARLTGPSAGILTIDFNTPTSILEFSVVVNEILPLFPGFTVELFDGTGEALNITHVDMHPEQFFSQARFTHAGTPVGRVRISFIITGDRAVFGLDNLTFDGAPVATCDVRLSPGERLIPNSGGAGTIGVIAEPGCDWSATTQDPFLTFMGPAGGTASGTLNYTVNAHADALSRTGTIVVNNRQFIVRQAGTTPFSALQPAQLFFRGKQDSAPQSQLVVLFTSSPGHAYTVSPLADFGLSWLTASETQGFSPATFAITADPAGLIAGTYRGTVTVTISTAEPSVLRLPVQMLVEQSGEAELSILPDRLTFHFSPGESGRSTPVHLLNGGGGSLMYESSSTTSSAEPWLSATDGGGTASLSSTGTATISANPAGLPEGTYRGTVEFFSPTTNERVPLPVRMVISGTDPALTVSLRGLSFTGVQGPDTTIPAQRFKLRSTGPGEVNWSVRTSTLSGPENWLQATPASGTTAEEPAEISVIAGQAGLEPGTYYGQVFLESSQAINSPQTITVVLEVLPPGSGPVPVVRPGALVFAGVAGRPIPEAQTLVLANRTPQARTFTIGATSALLSAGLRLDRNSGVLPAGSEVVIQVLPETAGMAAGIVEDFLTVIFDDGNVFPVPVTVILADIGAGSAGDASGTGTVRETGRSGLAGCAPERLWPSFTAPGAQFTVRTGWPVTMEALIVDDCGDPLVCRNGSGGFFQLRSGAGAAFDRGRFLEWDVAADEQQFPGNDNPDGAGGERDGRRRGTAGPGGGHCGRAPGGCGRRGERSQLRTFYRGGAGWHDLHLRTASGGRCFRSPSPAAADGTGKHFRVDRRAGTAVAVCEPGADQCDCPLRTFRQCGTSLDGAARKSGVGAGDRVVCRNAAGRVYEQSAGDRSGSRSEPGFFSQFGAESGATRTGGPDLFFRTRSREPARAGRRHRAVLTAVINGKFGVGYNRRRSSGGALRRLGAGIRRTL